MKVAILRDSNPESSLKWEIACQKNGFDCFTIDLLRNDWLTKLKGFDPDFCVCRPPGDIQQNKAVFDNKLFFIQQHTQYKVFPSYHETVIYENKASLSYFLQVNNIPHPKTFVSYSETEASEFLKTANYPVVAKTLIGAAGSGVKILKNKKRAEAYVRKAFSTGLKRRYGPNRKTGSPVKWFIKAVNSPEYLLKKIREYKLRDDDVQRGVVLFQEFIPHDFEWRCVKIGKSYFAYKKLKIGDQASGSKMFEYDAPPAELLDFTRNLCEMFNFNFMAVDLFHSSNGIFVNELQTIFGHKNPYICKVNDKPGRYLFENGHWVFHEGDFNANESYDLRLSAAIHVYNSKEK